MSLPLTNVKQDMLKLYDYLPSQNAYKVRLLLNHLQLDYQSVYISIFEGEGQRDDFRRISPTGAVPALALEDGRVLAESNAILVFLASGSEWYPADDFIRAKIVQWLLFEAEQVQSTVATLRHWKMTGKDKYRSQEILQQKCAGAEKTLAILDNELSGKRFLASDAYTIADMSVFAYVHLADEAGCPLRAYPHIEQWVKRVQSQPGFIAKVYPYSIDPRSSGELL